MIAKSKDETREGFHVLAVRHMEQLHCRTYGTENLEQQNKCSSLYN